MSDSDDEAPQLVDDNAPLDVSAARQFAAAPTPAVNAAAPEPAASSSSPAAPAAYKRDPLAPPVPLTILTGWLGAGKTTLLTRILAHFSSLGLALAIVQNEASSFGVEAGLRISDESTGADGAFTDLLELDNGCVCCAVKSDFVLGVEALLARKKFDYIVLECSGLADPGPLANMFWVDPELESTVYLDGIVSLVDARNFLRHLRPADSTEGGDAGTVEAAQVIHQIAYADRVVLNKIDLVSDTELKECERQIARINGSAEVLRSLRSDVPMERILHVRSFDTEDTERAIGRPPPLEAAAAAPTVSSAGAADEAHPHDDSISTWMVDNASLPPAQRKEVSLAKLKEWMAELLWKDAIEPEGNKDAAATFAASSSANAASSSNSAASAAPAASLRPNQLFRVKAILRLDCDPAADASTATADSSSAASAAAASSSSSCRPYFVQAVQELWDLQPGKEWPVDAAASAGAKGTPEENTASAKQFTRFVFIGRRLDKESLRKGFEGIFVQ